jgi:hypothetical protein
MTTDTFLFTAGWLFFAALIAVIAGLMVAAFGRDLLPWAAHPEPAHQPRNADQSCSTQVLPTESSTR